MTEPVHEGLVDHAAVDKAFRAVVAALDHPGTGDVAALFEALDHRLRGHLAREDLDVARFADADPEDAKRLLADHAEIRAALDDLGKRAKTGTLASADLHAFKTRVALHEAHEETGLYRWLAV